MPIYSRKCSKCDHFTEELESIHAEDIIECPKCQEKALVKLISQSSFRMGSLRNDAVDTSYR